MLLRHRKWAAGLLSVLTGMSVMQAGGCAMRDRVTALSVMYDIRDTLFFHSLSLLTPFRE